MADQKMKFDPLAVFEILEMMHASYCHFGAQRKRKIEKTRLQNHLDFCIAADQQSKISDNFLIIHDESRRRIGLHSKFWPS